ncbi:MAG: hypothetical protein RR383_09840, partial [Muribaculaceae bacterium]
IVETDNILDWDKRIVAEIESCSRTLMSNVSLRWLEDKDITSRPIRNDDGSGYIELPCDFLRLVRFKMRGWKKSVTKAISEHDSTYIAQSYYSLRGGCSRPVVAIVNANGAQRLEYYSLPATIRTHSVEIARYIKQPAEVLNGWDIPEKIFNALCCMIARNVAITFSDTNKVKLLTEMADEQIKMLL